MGDQQQVVEYWEQAHQSQDATRLTGTSLAGHLEFLKVSVLPNKNTLCIGIGDGSWVKEVVHRSFKKGGSVWSLDIVSDNVVGAVPICNPMLLPSNFFSLAMSLWVVPHMDDDGLVRQMKCIVRSLSENGVLAIHYNEPLSAEQYVAPACIGTMLAGTVLRTRDTFNEIVRDAGGTSEIVNVQSHPEYDMQMVAAHVRKKYP
jgi:hypothetical protein